MGARSLGRLAILVAGGVLGLQGCSQDTATNSSSDASVSQQVESQARNLPALEIPNAPAATPIARPEHQGRPEAFAENVREREDVVDRKVRDLRGRANRAMDEMSDRTDEFRERTGLVREKADELKDRTDKTVDDLKDQADKTIDRAVKQADAAISKAERRVDKAAGKAEDMQRRAKEVGDNVEKTARSIKDLIRGESPDR
jgi:hypothetical protein